MTSQSLIGGIEKIIDLGYKPVLAHVERYFFLTMSDVRKMEKLRSGPSGKLKLFFQRPEKKNQSTFEKIT